MRSTPALLGSAHPSIVIRLGAALLAIVSVASLGCGPSAPPDGASSDLGAPATPALPDISALRESESFITFDSWPAVDLYYRVRAQAARRVGDMEPDDLDWPTEQQATLEDAVDATVAIQSALSGSFGGWGPVDTYLLAADDAAQAREYVQDFRDPLRYRGREVSIRSHVHTLFDALVGLEPWYTGTVWPDVEARRRRVQALLEQSFVPRQRVAFAHMLDSLGITDPASEVPVVLVEDANPPGAMTYRLRGGSACVVDFDLLTGSSMFEMLLHETTHVLDASADPESAFAALRSALSDLGFERFSETMQSVPHLLMFIQAEETVRRVYDSGHIAYGETHGVYGDSGGRAEVMRRHWRRFLAGDVDRPAALQAMLDEMALEGPK